MKGEDFFSSRLKIVYAFLRVVHIWFISLAGFLLLESNLCTDPTITQEFWVSLARIAFIFRTPAFLCDLFKVWLM